CASCNESVIDQVVAKDFAIVDFKWFTGDVLVGLMPASRGQYGVVPRRDLDRIRQSFGPRRYFSYLGICAIGFDVRRGTFNDGFSNLSGLLVMRIIVRDDHDISIFSGDTAHEWTLNCIALSCCPED